MCENLSNTSTTSEAAPRDPRVEVVLHEGLFNPDDPVHEENLQDLLVVHVLGNLLHKTLQNLFL